MPADIVIVSPAVMSVEAVSELALAEVYEISWAVVVALLPNGLEEVVEDAKE